MGHQRKTYANKMMVAILLTSVVMRCTISAVGPVLHLIQEEYALSGTVAGSITTIPMVLFALMSLSTPMLLRRIGAQRLQITSVALICAGLLSRAYLGVVGLFAGMMLYGLGIGACNMLIPRAIKEDFPDKVELMTGLYTACMSLFAALGSGISVPMAASLGWRHSLVVWSPFAFVALFSWFSVNKARPPFPEKRTQITQTGVLPLLRSPMAWKLTICMGSQSAAYFCVLAWLPTFLQSRGISPQAAGYAHLAVQIAGMATSFAVPMLMRRTKDQRKCLIPVALMLIFGVASLLVDMPPMLRYTCLLFIGFGIGSGLAYTMTVLSLRANSPEQVVSLSAMVQTGGYIIAAIGPTLVGGLYDLFGSLRLQLLLLLAFAVLYLVFGTMVAQRPDKPQGI